MRRAGHKRVVSLRARTATPSVGNLSVAVAGAAVDDELLLRAKAIARVCSDGSDDRDAHHRAVEIAVQQRITARLQGRVRNLLVRSFDNLVILEGQCATYYSKQLAQHAAMGVLEDEHLENAIVVNVQQ